MMTKKVNIYPTRPIITVNPPIRSMVKEVTKPLNDIRACILARAIVEEITDNGVIKLDLNNYDKDNNIGKKEYSQPVIEEVVEEAPPVVEEVVEPEPPVLVEPEKEVVTADDLEMETVELSEVETPEEVKEEVVEETPEPVVEEAETVEATEEVAEQPKKNTNYNKNKKKR